jgi:hypothetical protein
MDAVRCLVVVVGTDGTTKLVSAGDDCEICVRDFSNLKNDAKSTARCCATAFDFAPNWCP